MHNKLHLVKKKSTTYECYESFAHCQITLQNESARFVEILIQCVRSITAVCKSVRRRPQPIRGTLAAMSPRRSSFDPLTPSNGARWLVVRDMCRRVLEHRKLPPGTDLRAAFVKALAAHADEGWQLETFSSDLACGFCGRRGERRAITIEAEDPFRPGCHR